MTRRLAWIALAAGAVVLGARIADGAPRVVIVESAGGPPLAALGAQVAVQSGAIVEVAAIDGATRGVGFVEEAARLAIDRDATLVVWVAQEGGGDETSATYVVYAAGRLHERAVIELVRVPAMTPASELERVIALKVASLLDALLAPVPAVVALGVPGIATETPPPSRRPRWSIDVGGVVALDGPVGGIVLRGARWWRADGVAAAIDLEARWLPSRSIDAPEAQGTIAEVDAVAGGRVELDLGPVRGLVAGSANVAVLRARGSTPDGRAGSPTVAVPMLGVTAGVSRRLTGPLSLVLTIGYERALIHQRFSVDGTTVADLGDGRWLAGLSMSVDVP